MRWVLDGFPVVEIIREGKTQGGRERIDNCYGYVPRFGRHSHKLTLNSVIFDSLEQAYRDGDDYDTIVFILFVTVAHEFGHYLNTCVIGPSLIFSWEVPY